MDAFAGHDAERRGLWLTVAAGLVLVLRTLGGGFVIGPVRDWQLWLYALSVALIGGCVLLAGLTALPRELRSRAPGLGSDERRTFGIAVALFVGGLLVSALSAIASAIAAITRDPVT